VAVEVGSWELGIGRKVLPEESRMDGERRRKMGRRDFLKREFWGKKGFLAGAQSFVASFIDFLPLR
jgi:hypothetical protein